MSLGICNILISTRYNYGSFTLPLKQGTMIVTKPIDQYAINRILDNFERLENYEDILIFEPENDQGNIQLLKIEGHNQNEFQIMIYINSVQHINSRIQQLSTLMRSIDIEIEF